jgi:hypothetical protein
MAETQIRFDDGAAYERYMGDWSRRAGTVFLDRLEAPSGLNESTWGAATALSPNS